jgi:hypothetical protein
MPPKAASKQQLSLNSVNPATPQQVSAQQERDVVCSSA